MNNFEENFLINYYYNPYQKTRYHFTKKKKKKKKKLFFCVCVYIYIYIYICTFLGSNNSNNGCDNSDHFPMSVCVCLYMYIWILDSSNNKYGCISPDCSPLVGESPETES